MSFPQEFAMSRIYSSLFFTPDEAAEVMRVKRRTLDNYRWRGEGPRFRRHGGRIVYHRDDLLAWSEQRRARMASERAQPAPARASPDHPQPLAADGDTAELAPAAVERKR
jgi:hypothetical protein